MSRKSRKNKNLKPHIYRENRVLNHALITLAQKRTGGAINIRGIGYQLWYSCYKLLNELADNDPNKKIGLEGIEDVDVIKVDETQYIQLKSSVNQVDASSFWNMGVLKNFLDVYKLNPRTNLRLVYNFALAKGKLTQLVRKSLTNEDIEYWSGKFSNASIDVSDIDLKNFLTKICFEQIQESDLIDGCTKMLIEKYELNKNVHNQYLKALFYNAFNWAKQRTIVNYKDFQQSIQTVTDSFSKSPKNPAIQYNWINKVSFEISNPNSENGYYDGKAARPIHIAQNLPVPRNEWEKVIQNSVEQFDVTVIKSSSGQGKSSLAWRCANKLLDLGYSIYELNHCSDWENVAGIFDFVESRLKIGELPLLVIDGLNGTISNWKKLVEQLAQLPVKLLVTTREEDWYRYGLDASKSRLQIIDIKLKMTEAKEIFNQLKRKGKVHSSIKNWQSIWENVESKGLLIEYVYLLTHGQMIEERITHQVKELNKESDAGAKIEMLRLIALSDVLNLKIKSEYLIKYVQEKIGFGTDRGELLKQLEKEYYIRLDQEYVEGLHPVRSRHLVKVLHETTSVEESLKVLYGLIEGKFVYDYFVSVPSLLKEANKLNFYSELAKMTSLLKFSEMVYALDGLMHSEPYRYWQKNKAIFDEVFEQGGLGMFVGETLPFFKLNTIDNLKKTLGDKETKLQYYSEKLKELTPYEIENSDLVYFAKSLASELKDKTRNTKQYEGLGFLVKWFKQLNIVVPFTLDLGDEDLLRVLEERDVGESSELCNFMYLSYPKFYDGFIKKHRASIISILKRKSNSLTIEESGKDVHIKYLLDNNADQVNELSVHRIQIIYNILPIYERYCTEVIILPFPNPEIYKTVVQSSIKKMPNKNITDTFNVHINQIWIKTIEYNYRASSSYDWLEQVVRLREEALEFAKRCIRYFESTIDENTTRIKSSTTPLIEQAQLVSNLISTKTKYPASSKKYFEVELFKKEQATITEWCASLNNFINQFARIIQPKTDNDRNLALINLNDAVYKLGAMQKAFKEVLKGFQYFNVDSLELDEKDWCNRLFRTVSFYIHLTEHSGTSTGVVKDAVNSWWESFHENELLQVHQIIKEFEEESYFTFHLPNRIIKEENLKYAVVGVDQLDLNDLEDEVLELLGGLTKLVGTGVDFFSFVNIANDRAIGAFRVHRDFIEKVKTALEIGDFEESDYGNPIPLNVDEELINSLNGISISKVPFDGGNEVFFKMMFDVWKLSEHRSRLDTSSFIENNWLEELEKEYGERIKGCLDEIQSAMNPIEFDNYNLLINDLIRKKRVLSKDDIVMHLNDKIQHINKQMINK